MHQFSAIVKLFFTCNCNIDFQRKITHKECIPFTMIVVGMMIIPIGNDLYQNNFSMGHMVTGDILIIVSGIL